eukprot:scaffold332048_cov47-Attheya_sp.AAC.1
MERGGVVIQRPPQYILQYNATKMQRIFIDTSTILIDPSSPYYDRITLRTVAQRDERQTRIEGYATIRQWN